VRKISSHSSFPVPSVSPPSSPTIGLALGSGSARGWAHIGVIQALNEAGVPISYVAGSSIGALVGGAFCAGQIGELEREVRHLDWRRLASMVDIALPRSGLLAGEKIITFIRHLIGGCLLDELPLPLWAVATSLRTGKEVWIRQGPAVEAIRASMSVPGIFTPVRQGTQWLVDGGLANPVPVSVCRAMGADVVIAVNLNADILLRPDKNQVSKEIRPSSIRVHRFQHTFRHYWQQRGKHFRQFLPLPTQTKEPSLSIFEVLLYSLQVMQDRITRHRLAADPPDFLITPAVRHIQLIEFHRADEAIAEGIRATQAVLSAIREGIERVR
jgi:NTE family protein